jgi:hypothetical protein
MESRDAEEGLLRAAADPDDPEVRATAVNGLALLGLPAHGGAAKDLPATAGLLRRALEDPHAGVQLNAAVALALRGDGSGRSILERSLDRASLRAMGIGDAEWQRNALTNAIRAAAELGDEGLRPRVERLVLADVERDPEVRRYAALALERWRTR